MRSQCSGEGHEGCILGRVDLPGAAVSFQQPGVREAESTGRAGIRLYARMHLHVELDVHQLPELHPTNLALVRLLPCVDAQVSAVVGVDPEGLVALLALVRLLPGVLAFVRLEGVADDEALSAQVAGERPLAAVDALVVVKGVFVEERLATRVAGVTQLPRVQLLVSFERAGGDEAFVAGLTAEGRHLHRRPVLPVDDSAVRPLVRASLSLPAQVFVGQFLVFAQVAVVQEGLSAHVAHEGLGGTVEQHVLLQLVLDETLPADLTGERLLARVDANVPLQVVLEGEAGATRLAREHLPSVDGLMHLQRPPLDEGFVALGALVGVVAGVRALVAAQREGVLETLPTLGTLVQLLHAVHHLVRLQARFGLEAFPTGGADEGPGVVMHHLVGLQVDFGFEGLVTLRALKGGVLLLLVPEQVLLKRGRVPKLPGTLVAGDGLPVSVHVLLQVELPAEALVAHGTRDDRCSLGTCRPLLAVGPCGTSAAGILCRRNRQTR